MAQKKLTVYGLLLLGFLLSANVLLSVGQSYARYTDDVLLVNTVAEPETLPVTSDCLVSTTDAPLTVLLGTCDWENSYARFILNASKESTGNLKWEVDKPEYLAVSMSVDGTPLEQNAPLDLPCGETSVTMDLLPTADAAELEQPLDVRITVNWGDALTGSFVATLPGKTAEPENEIFEANADEDENNEPEEVIPSDPADDDTPEAQQAEGDSPIPAVEQTEHILTDPADEVLPDEEDDEENTPEDISENGVRITGKMELIGRRMNAGEFRFLLYPADDEYQTDPEAEPVCAAVNDENGDFAFEALTFTEAGDYYYVAAVDPADKLGGVVYDTFTYNIQVNVTDHDGELEAQIVEAQEILFVNFYDPGEITFSFSGTKYLTGGELEEGMFRLELYEADEYFNPVENPVDTVHNDADGTFTFELTFDAAGVYRYVLKEGRSEGDYQITYDTRSYGIIVTVTDDGLGNLQTVGRLYVMDGEIVDETDKVEFFNIFTPAPDVAELIRLETIGSYAPETLLPISISCMEGAYRISLGQRADEFHVMPFPAYVRYSLDRGASYTMLYYGGYIEIEAAEAETTLVLLDMSHAQQPLITGAVESTDPDVFEEMVELVAEVYQDDRAIGQIGVSVKAEQAACYHMESRVLNQNSPLEISFPEAWKTLNPEYTVQVLTLPVLTEEELANGADPAARYVDLAETDPTAQTLTAEYIADETGHKMLLKTGTTLPVPGTYRVNMKWTYEGYCFEQTQITFFVNYSFEQTQTVQEVPNNE